MPGINFDHPGSDIVAGSGTMKIDGAAAFTAADKIALDAAGVDQVARNNIMLNFFRDAINNGLSVQNMEDGLVDEFEDESGVDTGASTNEEYNLTFDFYKPSAETALVSQGAGTLIGDMTDGGGLAAAFDGNNNQTSTQGAGIQSSVDTAYIGKDWGGGNTKALTGFKIWGTSDKGFSFEAGPTITITLQGSTDNFSGSIVDLGNSGGETDSDGLLITKLSGIATDIAYRYHRLKVESSISNWILCAEVEFYEPAASLDMVLQSNAFTSVTPSDPVEARIVLFEEDVDSVTLNTDLKAYASRDGTTFTQITLTDEGDYETGKRILSGSVDISGQPAGTSMKWKLTTHNAKELKVHGVALQWS